MRLSHELLLLERNIEIQSLESELTQVEEIMQSLSSIVQGQGESLALADQHIEESTVHINEGVTSLAQAGRLTSEIRGKLIDGVTLGVTILGGAVGFIAGPVVGSLTLTGGITLGASLVAIRRKLAWSRWVSLRRLRGPLLGGSLTDDSSVLSKKTGN